MQVLNIIDHSLFSWFEIKKKNAVMEIYLSIVSGLEYIFIILIFLRCFKLWLYKSLSTTDQTSLQA